MEANGSRALTFHKILDTYEAPQEADSAEYEPHDEPFWVEQAAWTNETAKALFNIVRPVLAGAELNYVKKYIAIAVNRNTYLWIEKRAAPKSLVGLWVGENLIGAARALLDDGGIGYTVRKNQTVRITTDRAQLEQHAMVFKQLAQLVQQAWIGEGV